MFGRWFTVKAKPLTGGALDKPRPASSMQPVDPPPHGDGDLQFPKGSTFNPESTFNVLRLIRVVFRIVLVLGVVGFVTLRQVHGIHLPIDTDRIVNDALKSTGVNERGAASDSAERTPAVGHVAVRVDGLGAGNSAQILFRAMEGKRGQVEWTMGIRGSHVVLRGDDAKGRLGIWRLAKTGDVTVDPTSSASWHLLGTKHVFLTMTMDMNGTHVVLVTGLGAPGRTWSDSNLSAGQSDALFATLAQAGHRIS